MNITFVYMGAEQLGLEYLSAVLRKAGHRTFLTFDPGLFDDKRYIQIKSLNMLYNYRPILIKKIITSKPDLIGFCVPIDLYLWACKVAIEVKRIIKTPIIFGGIHPSFIPDVVIENNFIDMVGIGECEDALVELANSLEIGSIDYSIRNIWFKRDGEVVRNSIRPLIQDLNILPFPDKELFEKDINIKDLYRIFTDRGCAFACSFCYSSAMKEIYKGQRHLRRKRSIDNVLEELKIAKKKYNYRSVSFEDDVFTHEKNWLVEFLPRYKKEIGVSFYCCSHVKCLDKEIAVLLKETGCKAIELGIQSMDESTRNNLLNRPETDEDIMQAFKICDEVKLPYIIDHIFGLPYEDKKNYIKAAEIYKELDSCHNIQTFTLTYYPKVEITKIAQRLGLINGMDIQDIDCGREKHYFFGGSNKDKKLAKLNKNFKVLFIFMTIIPRQYRRLILKLEIYRFFYIIPSFLIFLLQVIGLVIKKDIRLPEYLNYYLMHFVQRFKINHSLK